MPEAIKREEVGAIVNKLEESKMNLNRGNIFSCLISFRAALEKMLSTAMLPGDNKKLQDDINVFQQLLAASKAFRDVYGPVTFRDNDIKTSLAFMKQLITIKEEEMQEILAEARVQPAEQASLPERIAKARMLIEIGDFASAREVIEDDEEIISHLLEIYNKNGIALRQVGKHEEAIAEFKKAIIVYAEDEGLYYNLARTYFERGDFAAAKEVMEEGMKKNPNFTQGLKLIRYLREKMAEK